MSTTLNMTLLLRRAEFKDSCVLAAGEPGYNTKTGEFKVGDGTTTWANLKLASEDTIKAWIAAVDAKVEALGDTYATDAELAAVRTALENQINTKLTATDFTTWKASHEEDHAAKATAITTEITTAVEGEKTLRETADREINTKIGAKTDTATADTVYGAIAKVAADAAADATTKADTAETNAKSHADSKAETALTTAKAYTDEKTAALRTEIDNITNIMNYRGAFATKEAVTDPKPGDVITLTTDASEWVYNTENEWIEIGTASDQKAAINALDGRVTKTETDITALDGKMTAAESAIDAVEADVADHKTRLASVETNKLDKATYESYINGKAMSDEELMADAASKASTAKSEAITEAGKLDAALHTTISNEIDTDIETAIAAEVARADKKAQELVEAGDAATLTAAKAYADGINVGVTKVSGGVDIEVTPAAGTGDVTVAHKSYGTGTYTKPDTINDANFVTGVTVENGHVTGASVKSLAEALSAMTFIFDGGTAAD